MLGVAVIGGIQRHPASRFSVQFAPSFGNTLREVVG
jgi:hypothetical protein